MVCSGTALPLTKNDWKHYCHHVKKTEEAYYKKNSTVSDVIDRIVISIKINTIILEM
jgi:hypothetical protein